MEFFEDIFADVAIQCAIHAAAGPTAYYTYSQAVGSFKLYE